MLGHRRSFVAMAMGILLLSCQDPNPVKSEAPPADTTGHQPSTAKSLLTFAFVQIPTPCVIAESKSTVTVTVPYGTRVDSLTPIFTQTGISASPASGVAMDFTRPVVYTLTSESKTTRSYTVTVTVTPMASKAITAFAFPATRSVGVIDTTKHTIAIDIPDSVDIKKLAPSITHTGKSISPDTGAPQDFTSPVKYTVTASDGRTQEYVVIARSFNASREIRAYFFTPHPGDFVGDSVPIAVSVQSTYQIASATVRSGQTSIPLVFGYHHERDYSPKAWVGTFPLSGTSKGSKEFIATITDALGNKSQATTSAIYDQKPGITLTLPRDGAVARPRLALQAEATDDDTGNPPRLTVTVENIQIASGIGSLSSDIDLSAFEGKSVSVMVTARDSKNQTTSTTRKVYVESSPRLAARRQMDGDIWDASGTRILYVDRSGPVPSMKISDSANKTTETIETTVDLDGTWGGYGFLTSTGAIYAHGQLNGTTSPYCWVYEWRKGGLTNLSGLNSSTSLKVAGDWAIYNNNQELYLRNLSQGTSRLLDNQAGNTDNSVASNGTVAYWRSMYYDLYLWTGDSSRALLPPSTIKLTYPITDGTNVVFLKRVSVSGGNELILLEGTRETRLAAASTALTSSPSGYVLNGGSVAFLAEDAAKALQVWRQDAKGKEQISFFSTSSAIELMQADGTVVFRHGSKRYLAKRGSPPLEIGNGLGKVLDRDGKLLVIVGGTLFEVIL